MDPMVQYRCGYHRLNVMVIVGNGMSTLVMLLQLGLLLLEMSIVNFGPHYGAVRRRDRSDGIVVVSVVVVSDDGSYGLGPVFGRAEDTVGRQ
jgi:hypothetical protein